MQIGQQPTTVLQTDSIHYSRLIVLQYPLVYHKSQNHSQSTQFENTLYWQKNYQFVVLLPLSRFLSIFLCQFSFFILHFAPDFSFENVFRCYKQTKTNEMMIQLPIESLLRKDALRIIRGTPTPPSKISKKVALIDLKLAETFKMRFQSILAVSPLLPCFIRHSNRLNYPEFLDFKKSGRNKTNALVSQSQLNNQTIAIQRHLSTELQPCF